MLRILHPPKLSLKPLEINRQLISIAATKFQLRQISNLQSLPSIGMDINKVRHYAIGQDHNNEQRLKIDASDLGLHHPVAEKGCQADAEDMGAEAVEEHYGLAADEEF